MGFFYRIFFIFVSLSTMATSVFSDPVYSDLPSKSAYTQPYYSNLKDGTQVPCSSCSYSSVPEGTYPSYGAVTATSPYSMSGTPFSTKSTGDSNSTISQTGSFLSRMINDIPNTNLKNGMTKYLSITDPGAYTNDSEVGMANDGINGYFEKQWRQNSCLQNSAKGFYREVANILKKNNPCNGMERWDDPEFGCGKRASIADHVGQGKKSYLSDGWLLKLAMKYTNGNPEAALEMIGMCGSDDSNHGDFPYADSSPEAKLEITEQVAHLKKMKSDNEAELKAAYKAHDTPQGVITQLNSKEKFLSESIKDASVQTKLAKSINCPPQNSDFYLPGSIGNEADISPELKTKVLNIQGRGSDGTPRFIPAKNYHVLASAYLGCEMVTNGMNSNEAVFVEKQAARVYRGIRICESAKSELKYRNDLEQALKNNGIDIQDTNKAQSIVLDFVKQKFSGRLICNPIFLSNNDETNTKCQVLETFGVDRMLPEEKDAIAEKVKSVLSEQDTAYLYSRWYTGGENIMGKQLPCSDIRLAGPTDLMNANQDVWGRLYKPAGWSDERYSAASKKLATWDVDFEWTIAEHEAGSKYGAKICGNSKIKNPFSDKACTDGTGPASGSAISPAADNVHVQSGTR